MNLITELIKVFGSRQQKILAIEYDNEKLLDEIKYQKSTQSKVDSDQIKYSEMIIQRLEQKILSNKEKIERLRNA